MTIFKTYLPLIMKSGESLYKRPGFCVGAAAGTISDAAVYTRLGLAVVGLNNFLWSSFEPEPEKLDYSYLHRYFALWFDVKQRGIPALIQFFGVPRWAQENTESGDSPIRWEYIPSFVRMIDLVVSAVPELVYVQVMNEPDNPDGYEDHYGCLGNVEKYLWIMRLAAEMKAKHPRLLLSIGLTTYTTDFFAAFAAAGGLAYVDQINVHFYQGWGQVDPPLLGSEFEAIRKQTDKPIWVTEANLLHDGEATPEYLDAQAIWLYRQCGIAKELEAEAFLPYALWSNWRNANIIKLPAETALADLCHKYNL